jgi:hypothetical protein
MYLLINVEFQIEVVRPFFWKLFILAKSCQLLIMSAIFQNKKLKNFIHLF